MPPNPAPPPAPRVGRWAYPFVLLAFVLSILHSTIGFDFVRPYWIVTVLTAPAQLAAFIIDPFIFSCTSWLLCSLVCINICKIGLCITARLVTQPWFYYQLVAILACLGVAYLGWGGLLDRALAGTVYIIQRGYRALQQQYQFFKKKIVFYHLELNAIFKYWIVIICL